MRSRAVHMHARIVRNLAAQLAKDNPNFDAPQFVIACGAINGAK